MRVNIVVARYNEDVEWTRQFSNVIIYNKGEKLNGDYNEVMLSNYGREGHTYYTYISENYENLGDYTVFVQGKPFDHSPNILSNLRRYIDDQTLNIDFAFLSEDVISCDSTGNPQHPGLPLLEIYEKLFNKTKDDTRFVFGAGAQFIVSKKKILNKPKEFYQKIVELLQYHNHPVEGFVIERMHKYIFE